MWAQLANGTTVLLNHAGYASMAAMYARWLLREARLSGPDARGVPEMLLGHGPSSRILCAATRAKTEGYDNPRRSEVAKAVAARCPTKGTG